MTITVGTLAGRLALGAALLLGGTLAAGAASQELIDAAKKEGKVVWYTGLGITQAAKPIFDAFMAKYPGIVVDAARYDAPSTLLRVQQEQQAKTYLADVSDGTGTIPALISAGFLQPYEVDAAAAYPAELKDPKGLWVAAWQFFRAVGYNTDMVPKDQVPTSYEDLLDPKWKGAMAWADDPSPIGPPGFILSVLEKMGDEKGMAFLKELAKQNIAKVPANELVTLGKVIEGQYAINLTSLTHHFTLDQYKNAPADWIRIEPVSQVVNGVGLIKNAPHPNAGKLFIDFILSDDGQNVLRDAGYIPAKPGVKAKFDSLKPETGGFKARVLGPTEIIEKLPHMVEIYKDVFK